MTASSSVVSLANRSLLMVGARTQISNLQEGSNEANAISTLYLPTYQALARTAPWNCLRSQAVLTLLAAAAGTPENVDGTTLPLPPTPWLYQYAVPSDSLQIRYIVPSFPNSTPTGMTPLTTASTVNAPWIPGMAAQIPYAVAYATDSSDAPIQVILCNQTQAQVVYTIDQPNPVIFDSLFEQALVSSLAAYLVPALSLNFDLMAMCINTAEAAITQARVRDGDEGVTSQNRNAQWMTARNTGNIFAYGYDNYYTQSFFSMAWPMV